MDARATNRIHKERCASIDKVASRLLTDHPRRFAPPLLTKEGIVCTCLKNYDSIWRRMSSGLRSRMPRLAIQPVRIVSTAVTTPAVITGIQENP